LLDRVHGYGAAMATDDARPSPETRAQEAEEARRSHTADRAPTPEEEAAAARNRLDPAVAKSFEEADKRGAAQKGEGHIP
jgi:hypothetical protein